MTQQIQTSKVEPFQQLLADCSAWETRSLAEYGKGHEIPHYNMVIKPSQENLHARTYAHDLCQRKIGALKECSATVEGEHAPLFKEVAFNLRCRPAYAKYALLDRFPRGVALLTVDYLESNFFKNECVALPVITLTNEFTFQVLRSNLSAKAYEENGLTEAYTPLQSSLIEFVERQESAEQRFKAGRSVGGSFTVTPSSGDILRVMVVTQAKLTFAYDILENSTPRALAPTTPELIEEMFKAHVKAKGTGGGAGAAGAQP